MFNDLTGNNNIESFVNFLQILYQKVFYDFIFAQPMLVYLSWKECLDWFEEGNSYLNKVPFTEI